MLCRKRILLVQLLSNVTSLSKEKIIGQVKMRTGKQLAKGWRDWPKLID